MGWSTFDENTDWTQIDIIKQPWEALNERQRAFGGMEGTPYEPVDIPEAGSDIQWGGFTQPYGRWFGGDQYNPYGYAEFYGRPNNPYIAQNTFSFQYLQFWIMGYGAPRFVPVRNTEGNPVPDWSGYEDLPSLCWQDYRFTFPRAIEIWGVNLKDSLNGGKGWRKIGPRLKYDIVSWSGLSNNEYKFGQIVSYGGYYYECLIHHKTYYNVAYPLNPANDLDCWRLLTEDGQVARDVDYARKTYTRSGDTWIEDPYPYKEPDILEGYGWHEPGDCLGWWLLDDLKTAFNELVVTRYFSHWINGYFKYKTPYTFDYAEGAQRSGLATTDGTEYETWEEVIAAAIADYNSSYSEPGGGAHAHQMNSYYKHKTGSGPYAPWHYDYTCWVARGTTKFQSDNIPSFCERQMEVYYKTGKYSPTYDVVLEYNDHGDGFAEGTLYRVQPVTMTAGESTAKTVKIGDTSLSLPEFSDPPQPPMPPDTYKVVTGSGYTADDHYSLYTNTLFRWTGFEYQ